MYHTGDKIKLTGETARVFKEAYMRDMTFEVSHIATQVNKKPSLVVCHPLKEDGSKSKMLFQFTFNEIKKC